MQLSLPDTNERIGDLLRAKAKAPIKPQANQLPCDVGLFSDEANQTDLIDMLMEPLDC